MMRCQDYGWLNCERVSRLASLYKEHMDIQVCHVRKYISQGEWDFDILSPRGGQTVVLEMPTAWFLETIIPEDFFTKQIGKARCSDEDNYNKKVGRELATSRMKATRLTCVSNSMFNETRITILKDNDGNHYAIENHIKYKNPRFISYG